MLGRRKTES